jgi:ornithine decarboxylase
MIDLAGVRNNTSSDAVVAGPSCDGDDVLYQRYPLPYAWASFNGFPPLAQQFVGSTHAAPTG